MYDVKIEGYRRHLHFYFILYFIHLGKLYFPHSWEAHTIQVSGQPPPLLGSCSLWSFLISPRYKPSLRASSPPSELQWPQVWLHSTSIFYCIWGHRAFAVAEFALTSYSVQGLAHSSCLINGCPINFAKDLKKSDCLDFYWTPRVC